MGQTRKGSGKLFGALKGGSSALLFFYSADGDLTSTGDFARRWKEYFKELLTVLPGTPLKHRMTFGDIATWLVVPLFKKGD